MSSPPATRRSERKRTANIRAADLSSPIPLRPRGGAPASRKRKASNTAPGPSKRRLNQISPDADAAESQAEESDDETAVDDDEQDTNDIDQIIPYLHTADDPVAVAQEHSNDIKYGENMINAYAKICGKNWTYYVKSVNIYFGRAPEQLYDPKQTKPEDPPIHIDLGPSKVVSRVHAELRYSTSDHTWRVHCFGRNGVRVNDKSLKRSESVSINNGDVVAVAGTEMLWQPATGEGKLHQMFLDRMKSGVNRAENKGLGEELEDRRPPAPVEPDAHPQGGAYVNGFSHSPGGPYYGGGPAIAPAPANVARPVTPRTSPPKRAINTGSAKKRSPGYKRGILMESTEQIDYSLESSKDIKPQCSYAAMITWAILSTEDQALSLNGIYSWIKEHYAYYRCISSGWQNSIRHNLSLNPGFEKVPRRPDEPGKGMKWSLVSDQRETTISIANKHASKGGGRISSAPGSPAGHPQSSGFPQVHTNGHLNSSPNSRTPPLSSFPVTTQESYTPTRPVHRPYAVYAPTQPPHPVLSDETSPMPRRRANGHLTAGDSSPTLTSGAWAHDQPMQTPAPRPHNLNVPQPNTARLPTSHMADSSPAPFFQFHDYRSMNSTPLQPWPELSPTKIRTAGDATVLQSSSPPPATNGVGADSPTRKGKPTNNSFPSSQNGTGHGSREDEDDSIDITKGFTKISSYHQKRSNGAANGASS